MKQKRNWQKHLSENQSFDKTREEENGAMSIEELLDTKEEKERGLFLSDILSNDTEESKIKEEVALSEILMDCTPEKDNKSLDNNNDIFPDYTKESEREEETILSNIFMDCVPEKDNRLLSNNNILSNGASELEEIEKKREQAEDDIVEQEKITKREKIKHKNIEKEKNDVKNSTLKERYFNKDTKVTKENTRMKDLSYELTKFLGIKVIHSELYIYEEGIYNLIRKEEDLGKFLMKLLPDFCQQRISKYTNFKEIFQWLKVIPELQVENFEEEMERNATYIPFQNGLYDIATGRFLEYSEERLIFYKLKADYLGRECDLSPVWNNFLFGISPVDKEVSTILCQMILNCLLIGNKSKTFALMLPAPNSGKSVLGNVLIEIIGREHITTRSFSELSKRFGLANLEGMALNICMEADINLSKATIRCIKGLTGENYINSEAKGANHKVIYNNVKLVFGVNDIPILEETDEAFFNRLQCIPMMYSIPVEQQDKFLLQKLIEEADGFLSWLVNNEATKQFVYNNFSYSYCGQAEELKQAIKERCENNHFLDVQNDMVQEFVDLCIEQTEDKKDFISNQILYLAYQAFCKEKGVAQVCQQKAFSRKFSKLGIGMKSKSYDSKIESKSPLNGFKGIRLINEVVYFE